MIICDLYRVKVTETLKPHSSHFPARGLFLFNRTDGPPRARSDWFVDRTNLQFSLLELSADPNFGTTFGSATTDASTTAPSRVIQFAVKYVF
jgi:hypothetical protein